MILAVDYSKICVKRDLRHSFHPLLYQRRITCIWIIPGRYLVSPFLKFIVMEIHPSQMIYIIALLALPIKLECLA